VLDILSSDYIPAALLQSAFRLAAEPFGVALPEAIATVTAAPADAAGLADRGVVEVGRRADLARVRVIEGRPVVRAVWVGGERVA
jgi:alpha-D-ribose 1-methylphosphonate 5-triphosphate diphosphatase